MPDIVLTEKSGQIVTITLHRPEVLNALSLEALTGLNEALAAADHDADVRAVVLAGSGNAFTGGWDLHEAVSLDESRLSDAIDAFQAITRTLRHIGTPVIAAIDGYAIGGGVEMICACDLRIASHRSSFGCPEVSIGVTMTNGAASLLARVVGEGNAREIVLLGDVIDAAEAHRIGLVNRVVDSGSLLDTANEMAGRIASRAPLAVQLSKRLMDQMQQDELERALELELETIHRALATNDAREGITAFVEKRPARFEGR